MNEWTDIKCPDCGERMRRLPDGELECLECGELSEDDED